jgi:hypothetical protein
VLMHFAVQHHNHNEVQRIINELSDPAFEEVGLTREEQRQLINWAGLVDSDGDGMPDAQEIPRGLDPENPDWDNDGIPDGRDSDPKTPDTTAPSISIEVLSDSRYAGDELALRAHVEDNGIVQRVELWQDGELYETREEGGDQEFYLTLPERESTEIEVRAIDSNGNAAVERRTIEVADEQHHRSGGE